MASLANETSIANLALTGLGADRIISLTEDSENARKVNAIFDLMRDEVLRAHTWNFAIERRAFNLLASPPEYGFTAAFQIPGDVLRIIDPPESDIEYVIEGDQVLCDAGEFKCRCIVRVTDTTKWSTDFVTCFAARLEAELAYAIVDSLSVAQTKYQVYLEKLRNAKSIDATEGSYQELTADEWLTSRYGGSSIPRAE